MLRKIGIVLVLLCSTVAYAQFSKPTLNSSTATQFPDQTTGQITPATTRAYLNNLIASFQQYAGLNKQVGAAYTIQPSDYGQLVTFANSSQVNVTLTQASAIGTFNFYALNISSGNVVITPQGGSTIGGAAALTLANGTGVWIISDNTNWNVVYGLQNNLTLPNTVLPSKTILGNNLTTASNVTALSPGQVGGMLCIPTPHMFITTGNGVFTSDTCNNVIATWLEVHLQGGGGGGSGSGVTPTNGTAGQSSTFGALTAAGGGAATGTGSTTTPGAGGTCSGTIPLTQQNFTGTAGGGVPTITTGNVYPGGMGGPSFYGNAGMPANTSTPGGSAQLNTGAGGAGGSGTGLSGVLAGAGGGSGCHIWAIISPVAVTYAYTVGAAVSGGITSTNGTNAGAGSGGFLSIISHWQ